MEMDPLAVVLPQFALDEALAEHDALREGDDAHGERVEDDQECDDSKDDPTSRAQ